MSDGVRITRERGHRAPHLYMLRGAEAGAVVARFEGKERLAAAFDKFAAHLEQQIGPDA